MADLDLAIVEARQELDKTPEDHVDRYKRLNNLGAMLAQKFSQTAGADPSQMDESVLLFRQAIHAVAEGHPKRPVMLCNLAKQLGNRFRRMTIESDLREAIDLVRKAIEISPDDNPEGYQCLRELATWLSERYKFKKDLPDLNEAIQMEQQAIDAAGDDNPERAAMMDCLARSFTERYLAIRNPADIEAAILTSKGAVDLAMGNALDRAICLNTLAQCFYRKFSVSGVMSDLQKAIDAQQEAVDIPTAKNPDRLRSVYNLSILLGERFQKLKVPADLAQAAILSQQAANATARDDPDFSERSHNAAFWLDMKTSLANYMAGAMENSLASSQVAKNNGRINKSLHQVEPVYDIMQRFVALMKADDGIEEGCMNFSQGFAEIANNARSEASMRESPSYLLKSILKSKEVVTSEKRPNPDLFKVDNDIVDSLQGLDEDDLRSLLDIGGESTSNEHDELYIYICLKKFRHSRTSEVLHHAVSRARAWVLSTDTEDQDRARRLDIFNITIAERIHSYGTGPQPLMRESLYSWLDNLFEGFTSEDDIKTLTLSAMQAMSDIPEFGKDDIALAHIHNREGNHLFDSFQATGDINALNNAIAFYKLSLNSCPRASQSWAGISNNLSQKLKVRAGIIGSLEDSDLAIQIATEALDLVPQTDGWLRSGLGSAFLQRYKLTGSISDLDQAVEHCSTAVSAGAPGDSVQSTMLLALSNALGKRFMELESLEDISVAIDKARLALEKATEPRLEASISLGCWLLERSKRTGSEQDLDQAVGILSEAIDNTPETRVGRHAAFANLGHAHLVRFGRSGSVKALDGAIAATTQAINEAPEDHPEHAYWQANLGAALLGRYEEAGSRDDLDGAIESVRLAIAATQPENSQRTTLHYNLGQFLGIRYAAHGSENDRESCLTSYLDSWNNHEGPPSVRIYAARKAVEILISMADWQQSNRILQAAVQLLPLVSPGALQHTDKQNRLKRFSGLSADAAAVALSAGSTPMEALQLLEAGRGIISNLLLDMRSDLSDLERQHPKLAERFTAIRNLIDSPTREIISPDLGNDDLTILSQTSLRREGERNIASVIGEIRTKPGFHDFLLPPSANDLLSAADPDPIVIVNLSRVRSDAFVIHQSQIRLVPLRDLRVSDVLKWTDRSYVAESCQTAPMLEWLWDTICSPIMEALRFQGPPLNGDWPHLWWIPVGLLSRLPLHAGGYHGLRSAKSVLDRVMSSYASSVKALIQGHKRLCSPSVQQTMPSALLIAMYKTPGLSQNGLLPFVKAEIDMIRQVWSTAETKLRLVESTPLKSAVMKQLRSSRIFHFAGHGRSVASDPSRSCLLLEDWQDDPLTVGDLRDLNFQADSPFLGYLSACSTGANKDDELLDEGIHLIGALQLAGFQNVVGALWEVSDKHCVDVARMLYQVLGDEGLTGQAVCRGLHRALLVLRDIDISGEGHTRDVVEDEDESQNRIQGFWIPYMHYGAGNP